MKRVAFYGGSFDPPHLGHLQCVVNLAAHEDVDLVLVAPCGRRADKPGLSAFRHRYHMAQQAFGAVPGCYVTDVEDAIGGETRTLRTLLVLRERFPGAAFRFACGADVADAFASRWADDWAEIERIAPPIVMVRTRVSSTAVRRQIAAGSGASRVVDAGTLAYARSRGLYRVAS